MSSKTLFHQSKLNEWISRFADQKTRGLTVMEWCIQNNLSEYKYFYWKCLLKEKTIEQALPDIVPLSIATAALVASIINGKYVNALPLERHSKAFKSNGIILSLVTGKRLKDYHFTFSLTHRAVSLILSLRL